MTPSENSPITDAYEAPREDIRENTRQDAVQDSRSHSDSHSAVKNSRFPQLTHEDIPLALLVIFGLGSLIGVGSALLSLLLDHVQDLMLGGSESIADPAGSSVPWRRIVSIVIASIIAGVIWWIMRSRTHVPSVSKAVHGEKMPFFATIVHVITQIFIVGAGMSVGRETAPRELGSLFGQRMSGMFKLGSRDTMLITAVAAGAGFAGVYDAPLAGMFFAVEILVSEVVLSTVMLAFGTSAVAAFVAGLIKGHQAFYHIDDISISWQLFVVCIIIGPIMGAVAFFFRKTTSWASRHQTKSVHILWQLPLAGLITGCIAYIAPQIMGNGRALAQYSYDISLGEIGVLSAHYAAVTIGVLALLIVAKWVATIGTIRAGASGGVLTPAIAVGGALGAIIAIGCSYVIPGLDISVIALIASAAFLATSQKAPLMAACLMIELSHSAVNGMVALGVAVSLSVLVSNAIEKIFNERKVALSAQIDDRVK